MVWSVDGKQGNEAFKIRWPVVQYTRGIGCDIGCGPDKLFPHFIGIDNGHHEIFGYKIKPDVRVRSAEDMGLFASQSMDFVFSSHLLEHFPYENVPAILTEWIRLIKPKGYLVLYLPDEDEYPKVGEEGANPDHRYNVNYECIISAMEKVNRGWDLVEFEKRNKDDEYSLLFVFRILS